MYYIFFMIILIFNCLHRLQSLISEVFILISLITTLMYSPIYCAFDCNFFVRILSIKNYFLDHFLYERSKNKFFNSIFQDDIFLKNYFLYQKNEIKGIAHIYIVSAFTKTFFQILSNEKIVDIKEIDILLHQYPILNNLKFGQVVSLIIVEGYGLKSLFWKISSNESRIYNRVALSNNFMENIILKFSVSEKWHYTMVIGRLHDNFINSVRALGFDKNDIQIMINALEWQINFQKLHLGDKFSVLMINSKNFDINTNQMIQKKDSVLLVVAVRLHTIGKDYYAFRADNGRFYNREAVGIARDFIQFPTVKPFRVSSNFNLSRLNPITGRISPHFGVDFAVPIGTPVLAIGDGEVIVSKNGKIAGNYIVIRHGSYCVSRYMHLNRLLVKPGQRVKKGESIAFSGNTGRSTGPHLHFEIWINHKPVNPLTATFLHFEKLTGYDRMIYNRKVDVMLPYLQFNNLNS